MNIKEIAIMKLFKSYLLDDVNEIDKDRIDNKDSNDYIDIDKNSLKKRNLYKCKLF